MKKILKHLALASFFTACTLANLQADQLPQDLEKERQRWVPIAEQACAGNERAYEQLLVGAVRDTIGAAMNSTGWLVGNTNCETFRFLAPGEDRAVVSAQLFRTSSYMRYPIGMYNHGYDLYFGLDGVRQDKNAGYDLIFQSILGGYGLGAVFFAEKLNQSRNSRERQEIPRLLKHAEKEDVPTARVELAWARYYEEQYYITGDKELARRSVGYYYDAQYKYPKLGKEGMARMQKHQPDYKLETD